MTLRFLSAADVRRLLPMVDCIALMREALTTLARGDAVLPLRSMTRLPDRSGLLGLMPGYLGAPVAFGIKLVTVMPRNQERGLDSHQGLVLLFDPEDGRPLAAMDASSITAIRTAAVSGAATRALAREDARELAILGSGVQAHSHLDAMRAARPLARVRVWSRNPEHARAFAEAASRRTGIPVHATTSAREAVRDAEIICTTTASHDPILHSDWIAPGAHINAVGACFRDARELDTEALLRARLYVDRRESAFAEAGDFLIPQAEGAVDETHIVGELGELFLGTVEGRRTNDEVTLFKSLGIAVEDLAAAHHVYRRALAAGVGVEVDLDGSRSVSSQGGVTP
jgi:ornithine cyclodeaminase